MRVFPLEAPPSLGIRGFWFISGRNIGTISVNPYAHMLTCRTPSSAYTNSFWVKGTYSGDVILSLKGPSNTTYANATLAINSNSSAFGYYETTFTSTQSYESDNYWELTFDASQVAGSVLNFDLVQLFPTTYKNR